MKPASKISVLIILIILAISIGWWLSSSRIQPHSAPISQTPVAKESQAAIPPSTASDTVPEIVQPFARTPYLGLKDPRWIERRRLRETDPAYQWRTPIEFFGKVVDENNLPVSGADVEISWNGTVEKYGGDGVGKRTLTSDANGLFHLHGIEGKRMIVRVRKEGYYKRRSWNDGIFEYAGFWEPTFIEPDSNKPVVFRLVKRPIAEPTLRVRQRSIPKPPTWQTRIDFLAQPAETASGGDIALQITRPSNPGDQNPFDWQLKIEGQSGAEIILSEEEFMLRAPDEGYQKVITKEFKGMKGSGIETVNFYVRNKARKFFAAVSLEVTPYYPDHLTKEDTACYIVTSTVNPNDSPNVEYDREKNIREMEKRQKR